VTFHYRLVDDLFSREEFERCVEEKIAASGDLLDYHTAAMLVVREAGRSHLKIRDLQAASSLVSLFAKVLVVGKPREFERPEGEPGLVSRLTVGDETGEAHLVLWDDKAAAVHEIEVGDVLEIVGRPKRTVPPEIHALALRKTACEIACAEPGVVRDAADPEIGLEVRLLGLDPPRSFVRKDGSAGEMVEGVIGNKDGVARLVCWAPPLLEGLSPGCCIRITGATEKTGEQGIEYSLGEAGAVVALDAGIAVPHTPISAVREGSTCSVAGRVGSVEHPRMFTTRAGGTSWVRNLTVADETGEVRLVLWGERAQEHLIAGDLIEIYNASARRGRYGELELSVGRGGALVVHDAGEREIDIAGTVIATPAGICIDDGSECYRLDTEFPPGCEVRVRGRVSRRFIRVGHGEGVSMDPAALVERADALLAGRGG